LTPRLALIAALARLALRETRRRWMRALALSAAALVLALVAVVCLLVALGIWLARLTDPLTAALGMAAGAAVLALLLALIARRAGRRPGALDEVAAELGRAARDLGDEAAKLPPELTLGGAALAGLLAGLALFRRKP
jgi:hypothetical protein